MAKTPCSGRVFLSGQRPGAFRAQVWAVIVMRAETARPAVPASFSCASRLSMLCEQKPLDNYIVIARSEATWQSPVTQKLPPRKIEVGVILRNKAVFERLTLSGLSGHLKVNCPKGAREATLGCSQRERQVECRVRAAFYSHSAYKRTDARIGCGRCPQNLQICHISLLLFVWVCCMISAVSTQNIRVLKPTIFFVDKKGWGQMPTCPV